MWTGLLLVFILVVKVTTLYFQSAPIIDVAVPKSMVWVELLYFFFFFEFKV